MQTVDCVSVEKRERQRIFSSALYNTYSHFGYHTATQAIYSTQARHNSAAQHFYLCRLSKSCDCSRFVPENELRGTVMPRVAAIPAAVYGKTLRPEAVNRLRGSDAPKNRCRNPSVAASCASSPFRGACNRPEGANRFAFYSFAAI